MLRMIAGTAVAALVIMLVALPANAITYGEPDGDAHPNVGVIIAEWMEPGVKEVLCSGTLIAPDVFLTAAHCTATLEEIGIPNDQVWVSFDQDVEPVTASTNLLPITWVTNPAFNRHQSDPGDLAVVLLDEEVQGIEPASLPAAGLFDQMGAKNGLRGQQFTAVGYGVHELQTGGGQPVFPSDGVRMRSVSSFSALNNAWLRLSQNPATGDGGTCYGDSGGPNFLGAGATETHVIAAVTVTGDAPCRATNVVYRLDTAAARDFLGGFVDLP